MVPLFALSLVLTRSTLMRRMLPPEVLLTLSLQPNSAVPLFRQLYEGLRQAILGGQIAPGTRLPSTRELAQALEVSRNTVLNAYGQLLHEGYLEGRVGSGTFVPQSLPEQLLQARPEISPPTQSRPELRRLSQRGNLLARTPVSVVNGLGAARPFRPGVPAYTEFPFDAWKRLVLRHCARPTQDAMGYAPGAGYFPLRQAIAEYLSAFRAVHCEAEQVLIVAGSQQALDLASRMLLDPGDTVWIEDPSYPGARGAFVAAGANVVPVPIDAEGLNPATAQALSSDARLVYVTPSHQYPLGTTMSLARRLTLLNWASSRGAWILEDDYDSEYRYAGRPLGSLQGLDRDRRVIYIGTFSKVLFPSLRLGYLVVPLDLVDAFTAGRVLIDHHSPTLFQVVLADFMKEGHFVRHIRRMRTLYARRQETLLQALQRELGSALDARSAETGLHLIGWLHTDHDDRTISQAARGVQIEVPPLSALCLASKLPPALLFGYGALDDHQIRDGVRRLARVVR